MARTGIPTLKKILTVTVHFIDRNLYRFEASMSGPQYTCLTSLLNAMKDCILLL